MPLINLNVKLAFRQDSIQNFSNCIILIYHLSNNLIWFKVVGLGALKLDSVLMHSNYIGGI
jgi:hypothetical protein